MYFSRVPLFLFSELVTLLAIDGFNDPVIPMQFTPVELINRAHQLEPSFIYTKYSTMIRVVGRGIYFGSVFSSAGSIIFPVFSKYFGSRIFFIVLISVIALLPYW